MNKERALQLFYLWINSIEVDPELKEALNFIFEEMSKEAKFCIEEHGDAWVLYEGRDFQHHGYNLCRLSDFDSFGERTRELIVKGLNSLTDVPSQKSWVQSENRNLKG